MYSLCMQKNVPPFFNQLPSCWQKALEKEFMLPLIKDIEKNVKKERESYSIFPKEESVFSCFKETPFEKVRLVILGQDPYHQPEQAEGLCFSVPESMPAPPSLKNIYKELKRDLGVKKGSNSLKGWASQGALLLNSFLTVREGAPLSHAKIGWELFTEAVILALLKRGEKPLVFMLWGKQAELKVKSLLKEESENILCLIAPHPSPLSCHRGFIGCGHFSKANSFLLEKGQCPFDFSL